MPCAVIDALVLSKDDLDKGANISFPRIGSGISSAASSQVPTEALSNYKLLKSIIFQVFFI